MYHTNLHRKESDFQLGFGLFACILVLRCQLQVFVTASQFPCFPEL